MEHESAVQTNAVEGASKAAPARRWSAWVKVPVLIPAGAALALLVLVAYQNLVLLPGLKAPRTVGVPVILDDQTGSGIPNVPAGDSLRFQMGLDSLTGADSLIVELQDASGGVLQRGEIRAPPVHQPLDVYLPIRLDPGRYVLVVRENPRNREVVRNSFVVVESKTVPLVPATADPGLPTDPAANQKEPARIEKRRR